MRDVKYLLRYDDICPTMDETLWQKVKQTMLLLNIKPILAVIPQNENEQFINGPEIPDFWQQVSGLQTNGWTIALHGHNHIYTTQSTGILGITPRSEFAGISYENQAEKIRKGIEVFSVHKIIPEVWVAPAHSFDRNTMKILKINGIDVISDGLAEGPYRKDGFLWVPCQKWSFSNCEKPGLYTICIHLSKMNVCDVEKLCNKITDISSNIVDLQYIKNYKLTIFENYKNRFTNFLKTNKRKIQNNVKGKRKYD